MGGNSYSSSTSSLGSGESGSMGSQRELTNISGAYLYLIDSEESVRMTSGEFSLKLLKQTQTQTHSPALAVAVASVGELQWPVGKDAPVLKVGNRRYTFALPGLVYGMILPDSTPVAVLHHFEATVAEYSTFETHFELANAVQFASSGGRDDAATFWTAVAPEVETMSSAVARTIDSASTVVASSTAMGGNWVAASGIDQRGDGGVSPRMVKRMQQARRMSAVAKLMSRALLKGAISATSGHVSQRLLGLDINAVSTAKLSDVAVASVDAFGKVVEAVETAGKSHDRCDFGHELAVTQGNNFINTAWTLNKMGVKMLLRITAASTVLSTRFGSNSRSTATSTVTDDDQISFSSSTFSTGSTMPMKQQPQTLLHSLQPFNPRNSHPHNLFSQHSLHTSQLFPTSAEQMRNMPPGSYTGAGILSPAPRRNGHWNVPQAQSPFFQPAGTNLHME